VPVPAAHHEPVVDRLAEVWASLAEACERLEADQWDRTTDCPGWNVKDQLAHLIGIERMLLGDPAPPALAVVPTHVTNAFGEINEAWVEARRVMPGAEVLAEFVETTNRRIEALLAMPPEKFDEVGSSPVGQVPYREFMDTRVIDSWAHEQDIRRALGRPGGRNGIGEAAVLDTCERAMPYVVGKRVAPPDGCSVSFAVSGVMGRDVVVVMDGGRASLAPASPTGRPTVTLSMDQEVFWRLGFGRVAPAEVLAAGQVLVEGDTAIGHLVLQSMAFMI
jgi:uncharacterized protein (TIGR03083 family)